jgi:hypothetical protein
LIDDQRVQREFSLSVRKENFIVVSQKTAPPTHNTKKKAHPPASEQKIHVSAAARWVFARKEALLFALIVLPLLFDLLFSLVVVLE